MRKFLLLTLMHLMMLVASSQSRINVDNQQLEKLTNTFKTYSIVYIVNDTVKKTSILYDINRELREHFAFLKNKKFKKEDAEFEFRIDLKGRVYGTEDYSVTPHTSNSGTYYTHTFSIDHLVQSTIFVHRKNEHLFSIQLGDNSVIRRSYGYLEGLVGYSGSNELDALKQKNNDRLNTETKRNGAKQIWTFEKDFFYVFANYTKAEK